MDTNVLYCGDNLELMRGMEAECVDLIYADPPYFTQKDWGDFDDRFDSMDHYIEFMRARLMEMHRLLKPTGSIYIHCDWHASHRIRCVMDDVFGYKNFKDCISWCYSGRKNPKQRMFARKHDDILFYIKGGRHVFNTQFKPYRKEYIEQFFKYDDNDGRGRYNRQPNGKGGTYNQYLNKSKGHPINDVWTDIRPLSNFGSKHKASGYETEKPTALLERIVLSSSNKGDIVLDPFCGSGTSLFAAHTLGRRYIGIDQNPRAIEISRRRLDVSVQQTL